MSKPELGKVVAFYSYKGGTGRTMALANISCALAQDPKLLRPVLMIDWDLEAPGLHRYFRNRVSAAFHGDENLFDNAPGLIDLFLELRNHIAPNEKPDDAFDALTPLFQHFHLESYIIKTDVPRLHLLKAGRFNDDYAVNIGSFQWPTLYERSPYLLRAFADRLASDYDFVVIDSRTGLTDTSGICAMLMPEILVAVFTPNRQSLFGVIDLVQEAARYRASSDDLRPLMVYPLPSRIEASEPALRQSWRFGDSSAGVPGFQAMFEETFKAIYELPACNLNSYFDDVQIQHLPSYSYGEEIAVLVEETSDRLSLTQSYLRFTARLTKGDAPWASSAPVEEPLDDPIHLKIQSGWRWFISYNSLDQPLAERLSAAIQRKDPLSRVFTQTHLRAGGFWSHRLAEEIAEANAFILLVGKRGVGPLQQIEYYEALNKHVISPDFPVVPILLEGATAPALPFLRQLHWIVTTDPGLEKDVRRLFDVAAGGGTQPSELWRFAAPYRGLAAMTEADTDFFFGRGRETAEVIEALATEPNKLSVLIGNSGVGKSSLAQAGVLAALMHQTWPETVEAAGPWPKALSDSRHWCVLKLSPGADPVRALVETFLGIWRIDPARVTRLHEWAESLAAGRHALRDLLDATEHRLDEEGRPKPPAFLIYIDHGEELYVRSEERQRRRFSEILADGLSDPRMRVMMSLRADFFGELQRDGPLFAVHRLINVPPLYEAELREVVRRPAELLSAQFETPELADIITRGAAEESVKDAGALPLLSYTLDDMWTDMVRRCDGILRLPAHGFGIVGTLVERGNQFLATHPGAKDALRRVLTLHCVTVPGDGEPMRRRAAREEFTEKEWQIVSELADYPYRLFVTVTTVTGQTYAELAHEAIIRRWYILREWIAAEREFLAWRSGLEAARRAWQAAPDGSKNEALLMGLPLALAQRWLAQRSEDIPNANREFIVLSRNVARQRTRRPLSLIYMLLVGIIGGLVGWINQSHIKEQINWFYTMRPYMLANFLPHVLTAEAERALRPLASFRECAKDCPEMIVIPAGEFAMGASLVEKGRDRNEVPQHLVTIARPFAVSKFDLTFDDWDACVSVGGCPQVSDGGMGRGKNPVILVSWYDAQQYVAWLSIMTDRPYRLLTEAEWEYAARAGTKTTYYWGDDIGRGNANCTGCGSERDGRRTSPVESFKPNAFGLYDMAGNVWQWVEDCYHDGYNGAPTDGSAWTNGDCSRRVVRGGAWDSAPENLRVEDRMGIAADSRADNLGFRIGRTLVQIERTIAP